MYGESAAEESKEPAAADLASERASESTLLFYF
jgi:hypothetical protein